MCSLQTIKLCLSIVDFLLFFCNLKNVLLPVLPRSLSTSHATNVNVASCGSFKKSCNVTGQRCALSSSFIQAIKRCKTFYLDCWPSVFSFFTSLVNAVLRLFVYLFINFIVMFQPYYCNYFYFSFPPRLAIGYFGGKD